MGFPAGSVVKNPPTDAGDVVSIPGSRRFPREENGNPLQCPCLENPTNQEPGSNSARVAKSQSDTTGHTHETGTVISQDETVNQLRISDITSPTQSHKIRR